MLPKTLSRRLRLFHALILPLALLLCATNCFARPNKAFRTFGDIGQLVVPLSALIMSCLKEDNLAGAKEFGKTYVSTIATTYALKYTLNVDRPRGGRHSFPSGHASSAFAGAGFMSFRYGLTYGIPFYLVSAAVGASRINANAHSIADLVGSLIVSVTCSAIFTTPYKAAIQVAPAPIKNGYGLSIAMPM